MSVQNPTIPTPTDPKGIDLVVSDLQTLLDTSLVWLTNGMGRAYRLTKVRANQTTVFLPEVYLGVANRYDYFAATPDNDKQGQNVFFVGDATLPDQQKGFYGWVEHEVGIIFSANLETINSTLLATEDFTEHLIQDVREVLIRDLVGKSYRVNIDSITREFDDVYAEFDVSRDRGIAHAPMTHFRFNCTVTFKEDCNSVSLDRCNAILQNMPQSVLDCVCEEVQDSLLYDGVNEYLDSSDFSPYDFESTDPFSLEVWVYPTELQTSRLIRHGVPDGPSNSTTGYQLSLINDGRVRFDMQTPGFFVSTMYVHVSSYNINQWNHIVFTKPNTKDANDVNIYINGVSLTIDILYNDLNNDSIKNNANLELFGSSVGLNFKGYGYSSKIWDIELTADDVTYLYNNPCEKTPVQAVNCLLNITVGVSFFANNEWQLPDLTGNINRLGSNNMEESDKQQLSPCIE